jgi:hypothetical protein
MYAGDIFREMDRRTLQRKTRRVAVLNLLYVAGRPISIFERSFEALRPAFFVQSI